MSRQAHTRLRQLWYDVMSMQSSIQTMDLCLAEALAVAVKELKTSEEARTKANSSAEAAARQADKLTQKLANMPKVCYCCICFALNAGFDVMVIRPRLTRACLE